MAKFFYSDTTNGMNNVPFKSREAAERKAEKVREVSNASAAWVKFNGGTPRKSEIKVIPVAGGYKVEETIY